MEINLDTFLFIFNAFKILLLALLVERIMEIVASVWNYVEWKGRMYNFWNKRAEKLKRKYESEAKSQILHRVLDLTPLTKQIRYATRSEKQGHSSQLTIISAEVMRQVFLAAWSRVIASGIGFGFCSLTKVNLVQMFKDQLPILSGWPEWIQFLVSGVVIGLGSEPVHSMIMSMERKQKEKAKDAELRKKLSGQTQ